MRTTGAQLIFGILFSASALAQVSEVPAYETTVRGASFQSTSKIILNEETIKKSKAPNVASLLASQANISIATTSTQPNTIFLRGGDSSHILILVDGVPFFDASTAQKTMNLNTLDVKTIRRIEVLKGPQSVLYGGQALVGVIKIETFPRELKNKAYASLEAGRFEYEKASAAGLFTNQEQDMAIYGRGQWSQKMNPSPVKNSSEIYPNYLSGGDLAFISRKEISSFIKYTQTNERSDLQNSNPTTYAPIDTTGYKYNSHVNSVTAGLSLPKSPIAPRLILGHQNGLRTYEITTTKQHYGSDLTSLRFEADVLNDENSNLLMGVSYQKEHFIYRDANVETTDAFLENRGVFAKYSKDYGSLLGYELGLRSDFINHQDRADSLQAGLILLEKIKFEYATGYKTASLFQLFGGYGNADLKPEKSRTYSLSYEDNHDDSSLSVTLFETHFDDLITTTGAYPSLRYNNVSRAKSAGIETSYSMLLPEQMKTTVNFGYQEPRDVTNAKWLARRPLVTASVGASKDWEKSSAGAEVVYTGDRTDRASATVDRQLASHTVLNANFEQKLTQELSVYTRANNITDQRFEQTSGYYDEGFFALIGLEFQN